MTALDPFALGGYAVSTAPLSTLLAEYRDVYEVMVAAEDDDEADRLSGVVSDLEMEIAFHVGDNVADILGQVRILREMMAAGSYYNNADTTLCENIAAGLERLIPPANNSDIGLLAAEREMAALYAKSEALCAEGRDEDEVQQPLFAKAGELGRLISTTEPVTLFGAEVKLRYLADPEIGIAGGSCPYGTDEISLQQLYALVKRLNATPNS